MDNKKIVKAAIASILALGVVNNTTEVMAKSEHGVKCYGIAAANKNDCGTVLSACSATIKQAGACYAWIYVPKGICEKIVNSSVGKPAANCKDPSGQPVTG